MNRIFAINLFFFAALASNGQSLKLALTQGAKYEVISNLKVVSSANVMGQTMETSVDNENTEQFEVKSVAANNNELSASIKKIKLTMSLMGQDINYDSETSNGKGEIAKEMDNKVNKPYPVLYDDNGKILNKDVVKAAQPDAVVQGMIPPSDKVSLIDDMFIGRELKEGTSWEDSTLSDDGKMKVVTKGTYKVLTIQNGMASVLFEGTQTQNGTIEQMGMEMNTSGMQNVKREIMLDTKTGIVMQTKVTTTGQNNIETMGMSIPVDLTVTTTKKVKLL